MRGEELGIASSSCAGASHAAPLVLVTGKRCDNHFGRRYVFGADTEAAMPAIDEDDRPKKKIVHEIGQDLTLLSVGELRERVALLKEEIARLEANMASKQASKSAADLFFKK
jgi:uncharacterized small protein (DUF1192 family)